MFARNAFRTVTRRTQGMRSYASDAPRHGGKLRIGYVPEHFATPLTFAHQRFGLDAELIPQPEGTGALASRLKTCEPEKQLDIAFGLTEGFIADLGKTKAAGDEAAYSLAGTYVQSPLRWAISTGGKRDDVNDVEGLKGTKVGVSRIGSGSYVMSFVLADEKDWLEEGKETFEVVPLGKFEQLREGVNAGTADWFMWDHTTSAKYWDNGELKRIGEIYTPWPSWVIAVRDRVPAEQVEDLMGKVNQGVKFYLENEAEVVRHITGSMHYSERDVKEWMGTVQFSGDVVGVDPAMVDRTTGVLRKAGVLGERSGGSDWMVSILRGA